MKNRIKLAAVLIVMSVIFISPLSAQPSDPPGGGGGGGPVTNVPFGLEWLVLGAIAWSTAKLKYRKKSSDI